MILSWLATNITLPSNTRSVCECSRITCSRAFSTRLLANVVDTDYQMTKPIKPSDLSDQYWARLSLKDQTLYELVRPQPKAAYTSDVRLGYIEDFIASQERDLPGLGGSFELNPDFQRGHVWTQPQRVAFVEAVIRQAAPTRILFNCPGWFNTKGAKGDIPEYTFQCVDGLQRLTAVRKFLAGEFTVFDGLSATNLKGSPFDPGHYSFQFCVYEFANRADLLQFYLDLNEGGTVHSHSELERVRQLRDESLQTERNRTYEKP